MSHKNKIREKLLTDLARYHRNEMTGEERNSFERELQKDPFAAEAEEGLAAISQESSYKDLTDLQKRIKYRTAGKQRFMVYRIAASLAVLIGISAIFILIEKNKLVNRLADNSGQSKTIEIINSKPLREPVLKDVLTEERAFSPENLRSKSATKETPTSTVGDAVQIVKSETKATGKNDTIYEKRVQPSEDFIAREQMAARAMERSLPVGYVPPQPLNGKAEFDKYVQTNLHRPDSTTDSHRIVVVISFLVRTDGRVDSIRIIRSPGKQFSDEAIRVIKSGPSWKPAEDNGKPIEDNVRMRIVFK